MLDSFFFKHNSDSQANYDALRYSVLTTGLSIIHFIFCIFFLAMRVFPMFFYNIGVVIMYLILSIKLSNIKDLASLYYLYLAEILTHSFLATIFVGWDYSFMFYTVSLIPVSFYLTFSISTFKRRLFYPMFTSALVIIIFFGTKLYCDFYPPVYANILHIYSVVLSVINYLVGFLCTFLFSALFAIEVNSMQLMMEAAQEKLEDQAAYDPLTRFLNRRSMDERLTNAHRNAIINNVTYSLIMCDIDHFKNFNDTYGHDCGDFVLQTISKIISGQIRSKDSASRWGGEEFLLLVSDNIDIASEVAERIRKAIDEYEFYYEGKSLHVTITLGVAGYYASSKIKTLIEIADKRLYKGKENGRNQVVAK